MQNFKSSRYSTNSDSDYDSSDETNKLDEGMYASIEDMEDTKINLNSQLVQSQVENIKELISTKMR